MTHPGQQTSPDLFTGTFCGACPAADVCGARLTDDACSEPSRYRSGLHPARHPTAPTSLKFPTAVNWKPLPPLPRFIPVGNNPIAGRSSAIRLDRAFGKAAWSPSKGNNPVGAVLLGSDRRLDHLIRRDGDLGSRLAQVGADFVIAPGLSTWWSESPYSTVHAMARSTHLAVGLARHLPTIPTIVWRYPTDLDRAAEWIAATRVPAIALDLGTLRPQPNWTWAMASLRHLRACCDRRGLRPSLFVNGPSTLSRMVDVTARWPDATFLSPRPERAAVGGRIIHPDLTSEAAPGFSKADLLSINVASFAAAVAGVENGSRRRAHASVA